jgi:hypothetical protein
MAKQLDYEVGYGKPPKHSRFKKGQSGNPRGRPKGSKNAKQIVEAALMAPVAVNTNGKRRTMPAVEAFATTVRNNALKGDAKAAQLLLRLMMFSELGAAPVENVAVQPDAVDDAAAYAELQREIYNLFRADPDRGITLDEPSSEEDGT